MEAAPSAVTVARLPVPQAFHEQQGLDLPERPRHTGLSGGPGRRPGEEVSGPMAFTRVRRIVPYGIDVFAVVTGTGAHH